MIRVEEIELHPEMQRRVGECFLQIARGGYEVQRFDPASKHAGTKKSLSAQMGFYESPSQDAIAYVASLLELILSTGGDSVLLPYFEALRSLLQGSPADDGLAGGAIPHVAKVRILPDDFFTVDGVAIPGECYVSPNGLRIPASMRGHHDRELLCAKLLAPKLLLAAVVGLQDLWPWTDLDMDLNSTVHTIRPDPDKGKERSGYGGGDIEAHTDGYWNGLANVPLTSAVLSQSNPFNEPTFFIPIDSIFRIPDRAHADYQEWQALFLDLRQPHETPEDFVLSLLRAATAPHFSFVMGVLGGDAQRGIERTPLFEWDHISRTYLFRRKSTFTGCSEAGKNVVAFVNRMVAHLVSKESASSYQAVSLSPGEIMVSLNGSGLSLNDEPLRRDDGHAYPVEGLGVIHGRRQALRVADAAGVGSGRMPRTLIRGNACRGMGTSPTYPGARNHGDRAHLSAVINGAPCRLPLGWSVMTLLDADVPVEAMRR